MKKTLTAVLCAVLIICMLPLNAFAAKEVLKQMQTFKDTAAVGEYYDEIFYYEDLPTWPGWSNPGTVALSTTAGETLGEYGLGIDYGRKQARIYGTPTKTGTFEISLLVKNGTDSYTIYFKITVEEGSKPDSITINAVVGSPFAVPVDPWFSGDYGVLQTNCSAFGVNYARSGHVMTFSGIPTKATTSSSVCECDLIDIPGDMIKVFVNIKEAKKVTLNAKLGEDATMKVFYSDLGIDTTGLDYTGDQSFNTLKDFGFAGQLTSSSMIIANAPTKTGKATFRILFKKGYEVVDAIDIVINIIEAPAGSDAHVKFDAVLGEKFEVTVPYSDFPVLPTNLVSVTADTAASSINEYGFRGSYSVTSTTIYGTPAKTGTAKFVLKFTDKATSAVSTLTIEIDVKEPAVPVTPDTPDTPAEDKYVFPFIDVFESDWFYGDVYNANRMGLIDGKTKTLYKPADNMTYAEAIKLAACMNQFYNDGKVTLANGTPNWYDSYVEYARTHGIPWDYKDYNAKITREDYVHIFYYALPKEDYAAKNAISAIPDVKASHSYYKEILAFYNAGILTGSDTKGTFNPTSNIKRSEVAAILSRMMDATQRKSFSLK